MEKNNEDKKIEPKWKIKKNWKRNKTKTVNKLKQYEKIGNNLKIKYIGQSRKMTKLGKKWE